MSALPASAPAALLVDNYFDKIHWFILVFLQTEFRDRFKSLYSATSDREGQKNPRTGFLSLVLAVCLTSLCYTNAQQRVRLNELAINPDLLKDRLLTVLRLRLLDIVSLGSIEAVQTCVLLGSYYLYHGEPELAWPICGCGLRIAQALKLHQRTSNEVTTVPDLDNPMHRVLETRKRCWWAIYEIETFCSMLYGFPLSIVNEDCTVELPSPYPLRSKDASWDAAGCKATGRATLLSYKVSMARLSIIVAEALLKLYGTRNKAARRTEGHFVERLITTVASLDQQLHAWHESLESELHLDDTTQTGHAEGADVRSTDVGGYPSREERQHLFRVQALALKLAFENARILVHRPLLSYRATRERTHACRLVDGDPFQVSVRACRDAAMQIVNVSSSPNFWEAINTYAVSFVALHLFTAGVALSIIMSLDPLSLESYESKMGLRRLIGVHSQLRSKSIVAEQSLEILKKLMKIIMAKETDMMLHVDESPESTGEATQQRMEREQGPRSPVQRVTHDTIVASGTALDARDGMDRTTQDLAPLRDATTAQLDFFEDPMITQALTEFEQSK
ncbi:tall aerial hyphae-4 [Colletotrichum tabaci]|uniref:Tall aerial hyphae-4 n=1 Tax=Colletotrichum tabaci TaxID=1209068 RepID=A0AAV9T1I0_9PEZI